MRLVRSLLQKNMYTITLLSLTESAISTSTTSAMSCQQDIYPPPSLWRQLITKLFQWAL